MKQVLASPSASAVATPELPSLSTLVTVPELIKKESETLTVGDVVEISVTIPAEHAGATAEIASTLSAGPQAWGDGRVLWVKDTPGTVTFGVTCYKAANCQFPSVPLIKDGKPVAKTETKEILFASVGRPKDEKPPEIYPPEGPSLPWKIVFSMVLAGALLAGALFYGLYRLWAARRAKAAAVAKVAPYVSPLEELERTLKDVAQQKWVQAKSYKAHYFRVSEAAKHFLSRQFEFNAEDRTTYELKQDLEAYMPAQVKTAGLWISLFEEMDIVKFTDQAPDETQAATLTARVFDVAKQSVPAPVVVEPKP